MVIVGFANWHAMTLQATVLYPFAPPFHDIVRCKASDDLAATACSRASTRRFGDTFLR
jgi:hypothetical protein